MGNCVEALDRCIVYSIMFVHICLFLLSLLSGYYLLV